MKILHLSAVSFTVKNLLLPQIDYLSSCNMQVEIACSPGLEVEQLKKEGYTIYSIKIVRKLLPIANLINIIQLARLMRKQQYDLVHVHTPIAAFIGRLAAKIAGIKNVVYTAHGFPFHDQSPSYLYHFYFMLEKLIAPLTNLILTQSYEDFITAQKQNLCSQSKIRHLSNGIDINRFNRNRLNTQKQLELRQSLNIPNTADLIIGTIGRLTYKKGSGYLIEAIAQLLPEFPNLHTVIIGGQVKGDPQPFQAKLLQRICELGLEKHVTLTGYRHDTPELLGLLDIFTLPTFTHEGLPRSIIEAMAMELPVVTTDIRGCREAVVHGKTGFVVSPRDSQAIASALKCLLLNSNLRKTYGKEGRLRVENYYDERLVFERLKVYYCELLKPHCS